MGSVKLNSVFNAILQQFFDGNHSQLMRLCICQHLNARGHSPIGIGQFNKTPAGFKPAKRAKSIVPSV